MAHFLFQVSTHSHSHIPQGKAEQVGSEGTWEYGVENACSSSVHSGLWTLCVQKQCFLASYFGGCCFFPLPSLSWFHKKNLNLGLREPGFKIPADLASSSGSVTFLPCDISESVNGPGGGIGGGGLL